MSPDGWSPEGGRLSRERAVAESSITHDTLALAPALKRAGHPVEVAEGTASAVAEYVGEGEGGLASKADLISEMTLVRNDLQAFRAATKAAFALIREETRAAFALIREETRADFALVREETRADSALVREEMRGVEDRVTPRLIKWIIGATLAALIAVGGMLGGAVYFLAGLIASAAMTAG